MQNNVMEWQTSLFYMIPTLFILLLVFPIVFDLRVTTLPFQNNLVVALFFFRIKLFYTEISVHGKRLRMANDKKIVYKEIEFDKVEFDTMQHFVKKVSNKIKIKSVDVIYNIGVGDAFESAMICGGINQLFLQTFLFVKRIKPTATLTLHDNVSYNGDACVFVLNGKLSFSLLDILTTFLYAFVTRKRNM